MIPLLNKKVLVFAPVLLVGGVILYLILQANHAGNGNPSKTIPAGHNVLYAPNGNEIPFVEGGVRASILADIKKTKGGGYKRYSIMTDGPKDKIMLAYHPDFSEENGMGTGGIMVIELEKNSEPKVLWEVNSAMLSDREGRFEVRDINNDGTNEILSWWVAGFSTYYENLLIFTWDGSKYVLINPVKNDLNKFPGSSDAIITGIDLNAFPPIPVVGYNLFTGKISVMDIDNDHIDEVIILEGISKTELEGVYVYLTKTYKWNGKEFKFWEEKKERKKIP